LSGSGDPLLDGVPLQKCENIRFEAEVVPAVTGRVGGLAG